MGGLGGGLEEMQPIFRQVNPEWSNPKQQLTSNLPIKPFFFHVQTSKLHLCIHVSDFHSNTFQAIKPLKELEDMRDQAGIGGPWTDFVDYLKNSLTSDDLKLVLDGQSKSGGSVSAKVIAQKSDGMPKISVCLTKLVEAAASEAMANINLELFKQFKNVHELLIKEQKQRYQLSKILAAEQEKNHVIQGKLEASSASRTFSPSISRQVKNDTTRIELQASRSLVPVSSPENNHSSKKEHDSSPGSHTFAPVSRQEKNDGTQRELHASSPASRTFAPSVSRQEKNDTSRRELHASPPSRTKKFRKIADLSATGAMPQYSSEKQRTKITPSSKVTNRVIPSYRREKVEGIILVDSGDEID